MHLDSAAYLARQRGADAVLPRPFEFAARHD